MRLWVIPALSLLAITGCTPSYPQSAAYPVNPYGTSRTFTPAGAPPATYAAAGTVPRRPLVTGFAVAPASLIGGAFRDIDIHGGQVAFWNDDPVKKREGANFPGRSAERLSLKNGGVFIYEELTGGDVAGPSDGEQLKVDLEAAGFREHGITFDASKLAHSGPFTYLAQSSSTDNCVLFRARFRHPGTEANERAYGNLCASKTTAGLAPVKAEMLYILSRVRVANGAGDNLLTAAATIAPAAASAVVPSPDGAPITKSLDKCGYGVKFSSTPAPGEATGSDLSYENGTYSEKATCSCRGDLDYAKVSDFDAIDNTRSRVEKKGFKFQKAIFDETPALGKELAYEGVLERDGSQTFLVGRTFFRQCSFTVETTGTSYGDLLKGRKFVASVEAATEPAVPAAPATLISDAVITRAVEGSSAPPAAAPRVPVDEAALSPASEKKAADETTPIKPAVATTGASAAPAAAASPAVEPASSDATATRLRRLKTLLDQQLITPGEYDGKRKTILDNL